MQPSTGKIGVRVLLAGAEARGRLHLRRILAGSPGVNIVGHVRPGTGVDEAVERSGADVMLVDAADAQAAAQALTSAARMKLRALVLTADPMLTPALRIGRPAVLTRPAELDAETSQSTFGISLHQKLLTFGSVAAATTVKAPSVPLYRPSSLSRPELIAIGSSTGGPQALPEVLSGISGKVRQPIVITQHMPAAFTHMLAAHLSRYTPAPTVEAADGMPLKPGHVYLAPGGHHLLVGRQIDQQLVCHLSDGAPEHFCRPAVDPMLRSITETVGGRALAVILTGMGQDGLAGCRALVAAGGSVLAQNEATSVVWGMPGAVAQAGLCRAVLPLNRIAEEIIILAGIQT